MNKPSIVAAGSAVIARSTSQILLANLVKNVALLLVMVIVSRSFGIFELGIFSLALAITTPFFAFALLGARVLRLTGPSEMTMRVIGQTLGITGAGAFLLSIAFTCVFNPTDESTTSIDLFLISSVGAVAIYKWADLFTELYAGQLQRDSKTARLLWISVVGAVLVSGAAVIVQISGLPYVTLVWTLPITGLLSAAIFFWFTSETPSPTPIRVKVGTVFRMGTPLGLAGGIAVFASATPQYFVAAFYGPELVGILAVVLYLYALSDLFGAAFGQAWVHRIQEIDSYSAQISFVLKIGLITTAVMLPISAVGVWAFSQIVPSIFGSNLVVSSELGLPLALSITLMPMAHLIAMALFVRFAYRQGLIMMMTNAVVVALASILFIPSFGLVGAMWAVFCGVLSRTLTGLILNFSGARAAID